MPSYCTAAEVKALAQDSDLNDAALSLIIPAVGTAIDSWSRRTFEMVTEDRYYDLIDTGSIRLHREAVTIRTVTTNASQVLTLAAGHFNLWPYTGPPYTRIEMRTDLGHVLNYSATVRKALTVEGDWGYKAEVPAEVKLAAILITIAFYNTVSVRGLTNVSGGELSFGHEMRAMVEDLEWLLKGVRRVRIESLSPEDA